MDLPTAFFLPSVSSPSAPSHLTPTPLTRGPWSPDLQHGGPPAALLAREVERLAGPDAFVARLTVEFLRPLAIAPLVVTAATARAGKKVHVIGATIALASDGRELARATATAIRRARVDGRAGPPAPAFTPPPPASCAPYEFPFFGDTVGYHRAIEMRAARGRFGEGAMAIWMRLRAAVVAGEATSPLMRAAALCDSGNGVSVGLDLRRFTFVNPDLTVYLHRAPEGEWLCLDATTTADPLGVGLAEAALHDERGPIGRSLQSLLVDAREAGALYGEFGGGSAAPSS